MPDGYEDAIKLLPVSLREKLNNIAQARERAEEIRLRCGQQATIRLPEGERSLGAPVTRETVSFVLEKATAASYHAVAEQLRQGFLAAQGGVRVGVCGTAVADGKVRTLREISSLCIRIPRQIPGIGAEAIRKVEGSSVLILSPPGGGKTTFLRELVRTVSDAGTRVGLADERGELAGMYGGVPRFAVGQCTDVMNGVPKAEAAMALLRGMAPEVVAMDEIGGAEDLAAVEVLIGSGVRVYASAHASGREELSRRPLYRQLSELGAFQRLVFISGSGLRYYRVEML